MDFVLSRFPAKDGPAKLDADLKTLLRILHIPLVEDILINQKVMAQQLRQMG
jgi:hypothetical protein